MVTAEKENIDVKFDKELQKAGHSKCKVSDLYHHKIRKEIYSLFLTLDSVCYAET